MRILVFIESDHYVRNYIRTGVFDGLGDHEVQYAVAKRVQLRGEIEENGRLAGVVTTSPASRLAFRVSSALQMYDRGRLNRNFRFRLKHEYAVSLLHWTFGIPYGGLSPASRVRRKITSRFGTGSLIGRVLLGSADGLKRVLSYAKATPGLIQYGLLVLVSKCGLTKLVHYMFVKCLPINGDVKQCLLRVCPDLVIIPSSVIESFTYEFIRATRQLGVAKTLVLMDNWDNLSSKTAFIENPDYLGVWGKQSLDFAARFHQISRERVRVIGSPRFEVYWDHLTNRTPPRGRTPTETLNQPYILFAGCAAGFDEVAAVEAANDAVDKNPDKFPVGTKVVYRPHPWGALGVHLRRLDRLSLSRVVIDPQFLERQKFEAGAAFQPDLGYYPRLLEGALFVICPLSTLMLESTIMGKRVLALAHDDCTSLLTPKRMLENYAHFRGVEKLRNLTLVKELRDLESAMLAAGSGDLQVGNEEGDKEDLEYFVVGSAKTTYRERLLRFIEGIESETRASRVC